MPSYIKLGLGNLDFRLVSQIYALIYEKKEHAIKIGVIATVKLC